MRNSIKTEEGFTLIELLITVVIIGILASVGVPVYSRYITSARASEAPTQIMALREYALSYLRSHPDTLFGSRGLLNASAEDCSPNPARAPCAETNSRDWVSEVVGDDNVYFNYYWSGGSTRRLGAEAGGNLCSSCTGDKMWYVFNSNGAGGRWSVSPSDSRLLDILPD